MWLIDTFQAHLSSSSTFPRRVTTGCNFFVYKALTAKNSCTWAMPRLDIKYQSEVIFGLDVTISMEYYLCTFTRQCLSNSYAVAILVFLDWMLMLMSTCCMEKI